jgi:hypothetical protein
MAAAATTVAVKAAGQLGRGPWDEDDSQVGLKSLRWARVDVTTDTGTYATGGLASDVLGALDDYGWSYILFGHSATTFTTNSVASTFLLQDPNNATPANRKILCQLSTTGAELANATAMTAGTFTMFVIGY